MPNEKCQSQKIIYVWSHLYSILKRTRVKTQKTGCRYQVLDTVGGKAREKWVGIKVQCRGELCGNRRVPNLECAVVIQTYTKIKWHATILMHCNNMKFLVLIWYYNNARCNHLRRLYQGYTGPLCTIFATFCKFIIISKHSKNWHHNLGWHNLKHMTSCYISWKTEAQWN